MARIIRQYDPNETLRRITIEIKEDINVLCGHGGRPDNRLPNGVKRVAVNLGQKVLRKTPQTVKLPPVSSTSVTKDSTTRKSVSKKSVVRHGKI